MDTVAEQSAARWLNWAFGLGIAAFIFAFLGLLTLVAVGVNIKAWTVQGHVDKGRWKVIVGSILSGLALLSYLAAYGHL